jgi:hypothetical protein
MTPESVFSLVNLTALAAWIPLAVLPRARWPADRLAGVAIPALLAVTYAALIAVHWGSPGGFSSLGEVATLFSNPWLLLAGWTHYLAFDLLVGAWEVRDARSNGIPHLAVVPCLILTFLFGPAGWLLYLGVREAHRRARPAAAGT